MLLLDLYQILSGIGSLVIAAILIIILFKLLKGFFKFLMGAFVVALIVVGILFLIGVI